MKTVVSPPIARSIKLLVLTSLAGPWLAQAAPIYWDGVGGTANDWASVANWSSDPAGGVNPSAIPGAGDVATFSATSVTAAASVNLNAARSVAGLDFTSGTASTLLGGAAARILTLGSSGISKSGAGVATIGSATATENVNIAMGSSQSWVNNDAVAAGTAGLTVLNGVSFSVAGAQTLTLDGSSAGNSVISGIIANGSGTLRISKSGTGVWQLGGANTFTGGVSVNGGTLRGTVAGALGPNTGAGLTLNGGNLEFRNDTGTTFTGTNTTVTADSTITSNRATAAGTTTTHTVGTLSIGANTLTLARGVGITGTAVGGLVFGATTLTGNATFVPQASTSLTLGAVSGSGANLKQNGAGAMILSGAGSYDGGTTIANGTLRADTNTSLGSGAVNYPSGGLGRLLIPGGVTIANNFNVDAGITGSSGFGLLSQTGTGQATVTGVITMAGNTSAGGTFGGGAAVGNELVVQGPINAGGATAMGHRLGRVIYAGGGTYAGTMSVTDTALVGATNGIPQGVTMTLGGSASATLDLASQGASGFDQTLAGLNLGNGTAASVFSGTVNLGSRTLTLTGNLATVSNTAQNISHPITATTGGGLAFTGTNRNITVADTASLDDLVITNATISGTGVVTKAGAGTLVLKNVTASVPLNVNAGTLAASTISGSPATINLNGLNFGAAATTVRMRLGATSDVINAGTVTTGAGTVTVQVLQDGPLAVGTYPVVNYTGTTPGLGKFTLASGLGHATGALVDTGSAIALEIAANEGVVWDGTVDGAWNIAATNNWRTASGGLGTQYLEGDSIVFPDGPLGTGGSSITLASNVNPSSVTFNNSTSTPYTVAAATAIGLNGVGSLVKTGTGTAVLRTANAYTGTTFVDAGVLELDHDVTGNVVLSGSSGVFVTTDGTLRLTRDDGTFTFSRDIIGDGKVEIIPHAAGLTTAAVSAILTGNNVGFTGTLKLATSAAGTGTSRLQTPTPAQLGSGTVEVQPLNQLYVNAGTFTNALTLGGTGFADASANIGALRLDSATWAGPITVAPGGARIGSHNSTGTISGNISGGDLEFQVSNYNNSYTTILTGTNSYGTTTIGGGNTQTAGVPSMRVNIGNGGTSGTLGAGNVTIYGDGANTVLGFDRSDGYTLQQTITGAGSNPARTFVDFETLGAGFNQNGKAITLGTASTTGGGQLRVGQSRAGAILNADGVLTAGFLRTGTVALATTNLNNGAVVNVGTVNTVVNAAASGSTLNINAGATLNATYFTVGEIANGTGGTVNQVGGSVNVAGQVRVGHFLTETSVYNLTGGSLTLTGDNANNTPSTAAAGANGTNGDNNLNTLATAAIVGGGIYVGNDGTGLFNQSGGNVSTNWVVLDNRTDTVAGANMVTGIDQYNLSGGTLALKSTYGFIQRNVSAEFNLSGGTVKVDNSGTGPGTGANLSVPIDAPINTSNTSTLDTNGATNSFVLSKNLNGTGIVTTTGGGTVNLNPNAGTGTGTQVVTATLAGTATINKAGIGTTTLTNPQTYTGPTVVSAGRLNLPNTMATASITVADGATINGEPSVGAVTLGSVTGSTLLVNPNTPEALTAGALTLNGNTIVDFTAVPDLGVTSITLVKYTSKTGTGTFALANARPGSVITDTGSSFVLTLSRADLVWSGATAAWDVGTSANWNTDADKFYAYDNVSFDDTGVTTGVTLTGTINPSVLVVNTSVKAYTLTGVISGSTTADKSGTTNLTLAGANTFTGPVSISGGSITIPNANGIGDASSTNSLTLDGGKLISTATMNLGASRNISVGANGGTFSSGGTAGAYTVTMPGAISGAGNLNFTSGNATAPTFAITGNMAGLVGNINVDSVGATTGATTLSLGAATNYLAGTITLNQGLVASGATGITLNGQTLPAAVSVVMNSAVSGTNTYRSQIIGAVTGSTVNGPISVNGTSIIQLPSNATNGLTLNGTVSAGNSGYTGTLFIRGTGTGTINGVVTMPNAVLAKTDAATWTINSTGNSWAGTSVLSTGSVKLGVNNALPTTAPLTIGQGSDAASSLLDLNGFNQEVPQMTYVAGTASSNRGVGNTSATLSTLTVNNAAANTFGASTGVTGGILQGNLALVKTGAGALTLGGANTFTGPITVNEGILEASAASGGLGSFTTAGRSITANAGTTIRLTGTNILGTGTSTNLPTTVINSATLTTTRYNALGPVVLNAGLLTSAHASNDSATLQSWQLKGSVTVVGTVPSVISGAGDFPGVHLDTNTVFDVADVTASSAADLTVVTGLLNQSSSFGSSAAGLTKIGAGTMSVGDGSFTGPTNVNVGTLLVNGDYASPVSVGATGTLGGNGALQSTLSAETAGGVIAPGSSVGTLTVLGNVNIKSGGALAIQIDDTTVNKADRVNTSGTLNLSGGVLTVSVTGTATQAAYIIASYDSLTGTFASTTGLPAGYTVDYAYNDGMSPNHIALVKSTDPYATWAATFGLNPLTDGAPTADFDKDGVANVLEFLFGSNPRTDNSGAALPTAVVDGGNLVFTFRRRFDASYLNPVVEKSQDLTAGSWSTITTGITVENDGFGVGIDKVIVTLPITPNVRSFLRVRVP